MARQARQSDSLREQIYDRLRTGMRHGGVGQQSTATERELAEELGVSRTPIREALALLIHDGLVVPTTKGFTLAAMTADDLSEIIELRHLLEPFAAASAIEHLSKADLRLLREAVDEQVAADKAGDSGAFSDANRTFRAIWTSRIANARIREVIARYDDHIAAIREITLSDADNRAIVIAGLRKILEAFENEDVAAVKRTIAEHVAAAEQVLARTLAQP